MNTGTGWSCSKDGQHKDMYHGTEMVPNWKGKQAVQRGEDAQNMVRFSKDSIQREREREWQKEAVYQCMMYQLIG